MKGLNMVQWINLNQNNKSVLVCQCSVLWEKTGLVLLPLVGLIAGRQVGSWVGRCESRWASRWAGRQSRKAKYRWVSKFLKFSTG